MIGWMLLLIAQGPSQTPPQAALRAGIESAATKWKEADDGASGCAPSIVVPSSKPRVSITLDRAPPTRLRCAFDSTEGAAEVMWEPLESATLTRTITLTEGKWLVSCRGDRLDYERVPGADFSWWSDATKNCHVATQGFIQLTTSRALANSTVDHVDAARGWISFDVTPSVDQLLGSMASATGGAVGGIRLEGRAFGALPDAPATLVDELFKTIAEVAVERAKAKGLALLQKEIKELVCETLREEPRAIPPSPPARELAVSLGVHADEDDGYARVGPRIFPHVCEVVSNTRLQDLVASPAALVVAVREDIVRLAFRSLLVVWIGRGDAHDLAPFLVALKSVVDVLAVGTRPDPQLVLAQLARGLALETRTSSLAEREEAFFLVARVSLAVAMYCHSEGGCDARTVGARVKQLLASEIHTRLKSTLKAYQADWSILLPAPLAKEMLSLGPDWEQVLDRKGVQWLLDLLEEAWAKRPPEVVALAQLRCPLSCVQRVEQLANSALRLLQPRAEDTHAAQVERAVALTGELLEISSAVRSPKDPRAKLVIGLAADVAAAISKGEPTRYLSAVSRLVAVAKSNTDGHAPLLDKAVATLNAVAAYAQTYSHKGMTDEERHEARKAALDSLIDSATTREGRDDDTIISLGIPVGLRAPYQIKLGAKDEFHFPGPQLALPLGVAVQVLNQDCWLDPFVMGFVFDLGQYLAYEGSVTVTEPRPDTALAFGAQLGLMIVPDPSNAFVIAFDARYAPGLFAEEGESIRYEHKGVVQLGVSVAYYVPLFDFN